MVAPVEGEAQTRQALQFRFVQFQLAAVLLFEASIHAQVGELLVQVVHRLLIERMVHSQHEVLFQPATGVEVAVEIGDLLRRLVGVFHQPHQPHVAGKDVAILLQLAAHEPQRILPVSAARFVEQHDRHQWALASLNQREHFQCLIQRAEPPGAEHQGIGLLDEEQLADEEEMERQQILGAANHCVRMLFEGQRDVQAQTVVAPGPLMSGRHDAATGAGDDHEIEVSERRAQLTCQSVEWMFDRCAR